jgi:2-polyprenyl-6-methoxyphenol hydroxylase-like FAD-dependent oxidoreductase
VSPAQEHTDVLIVGAGPVGLFLANECARRGLQWRLVEARPSQSAHSKALAIFPRTLEMLDMAGLVAPFLETANRVTSAAVVAHGRTLADLRFAPEGTAYQFIAMVPQDETERLLAEALRRRGGRVEYDTSLVAAVQDDDRVSATLDRRGERATLSATFVVGCDGAHSTVRHLLNLPFEGAAYDASFLLADVETNDVLPADQLQLCPSERGPVAVFPMSPTRRRIVATSARAEGDAPSLRMVQQILRERAPAGIEARALLWSSYFRIHHRHTRRLRAGRIFIAGDAAHIHSPFGGQGMNTGLHDVWNLAWKLDLAVRGHGTDQLLESYSAERLPAIKDVIATTHRLTTVMASSNRLTRAVRDTVMPVVSRLAPFQRAFVGRLSGLGVSYRGSPIVDGAGQRYFDDSLRGGAGIRSRFLLLVPEDARRSVADAAGGFAALPSEVVEVRAAPAGRGIALVRPDGYVAFSARDGNAADALRSVRSLLQRQTAADARARGGATAVAPQ